MSKTPTLTIVCIDVVVGVIFYGGWAKQTDQDGQTVYLATKLTNHGPRIIYLGPKLTVRTWQLRSPD